ncbi:unnamed protein product [Discosporangium mesarthrocarpum]
MTAPAAKGGDPDVEISSVENELKRIGRNVLIGGGAGVTFGYLLATYRGQSVSLYSTAMALNYGFGCFLFHGTEALIRKARGGKQDAPGYAAAGLVTGVGLTYPIGGRTQRAVAGVVMAGFGFGFYYAQRFANRKRHEMADARRKQRVLQNRGDKETSDPA